jgi:hypothetical protein
MPNSWEPRIPDKHMTQIPFSIETLEKQAEEQRHRVQESVKELQQSVRERMVLNHLLKGYVIPAAAIAILAGLGLGYGVGSIFRRR